MKGLKDVGGCVIRWTIFLQQFDFRVEYRPGKNHENADAMSRIEEAEAMVNHRDFEWQGGEGGVTGTWDVVERLTSVAVEAY